MVFHSVGLKAPLAGVCLGMLASGASAADWSATGTFSQSVEANDNRTLATRSPGATYDFATQLQMGVTALTPVLRFDLGTDISHHELFGPGADAQPTPDDKGVRFRLEKADDPSTRYFLSGSFREQDAISAQLADTGRSVVGGRISNYGISGGVTRALTPVDSFTWATDWRKVSFSSQGGTPYDDLTTTGTWSRSLTRDTNMLASGQFEWMSRDRTSAYDWTLGGNSAFAGNSFFGRPTVGLETRLLQSLTLSGNVGAALYVPQGATGQADQANATWLADVRVSYQAAKGTAVSFGASHSTAPDTIGEVQERSAVNASLRQQINDITDVVLAAEYNRQKSLDGLNSFGTGNYLRVSVSFNRQLDEYWHAQLSYRYAQRDDNTGSGRSNGLFLSAVRDITLAPP